MKIQTRYRTRRISRRHIWVVISMALLSSFVTACESGDTDFLIEMGKEWATEHKVLNEDGSPNLVAISMRAFGVSTGDPAADAALDAGIVVKKLETADDLAQAGAESGNMSQIQSAIALRPGDWSYREQEGALLLAVGDKEGSDQAFAASNLLVQERINNGGDCTGYALNMLRHREKALLTQLDRQPTGDLERRLMSVRNEITMLEMDNPLNMCNGATN